MSYKNDFKDTLSTTEFWFQCWLDNFLDGDDGGFWRPQQGTVAIPYLRKTVSVAGLPIPVAAGAANSHTPRYDLLGEPGHELPEILLEMMEALHVDMLEFAYLSPSSRLLSGLMANPSKLRFHTTTCEIAPYVDTTGEWDAYWSSRGKRTRQGWKRLERRLMEKEGARFACLTDWREIEPVWKKILAIEASGWKGRAGSAILQNRDTLNFYTSLARHWSEKGWLRLFVLYHEDQPIAFELSALYKGILHWFKSGYLESFSRFGPGQVLRIQVLRWAFAREDVQIFDMFGPETEAKRKWATGRERLLTLKIFRTSMRGWLAWARFAQAPRLKALLLDIGNRSRKDSPDT